MKKWIGVASLLAVTAMMSWAATPDEAKLRTAMKLAGSTHGAMGKKIAAKDATAADDAKKLEAAFKGDTTDYFKDAKMEDAVTSSATAVSEYKAVAEAVAAGKWEEAAASHKKASATCMGCHSAHREKLADGSYKVK
jgi:hypothetical protein